MFNDISSSSEDEEDDGDRHEDEDLNIVDTEDDLVQDKLDESDPAQRESDTNNQIGERAQKIAPGVLTKASRLHFKSWEAPTGGHIFLIRTTMKLNNQSVSRIATGIDIFFWLEATFRYFIHLVVFRGLSLFQEHFELAVSVVMILKSNFKQVHFGNKKKGLSSCLVVPKGGERLE